MDFVHFGKPTIVLSSPKAAVDLLDKRGNIYSSRPRNVFAGEICYRQSRGVLLPMGTKLRRFRTLMSASMSVVPSKKFRLLEEAETKLMLRGVLLESNYANYRGYIQRSIHSVAFCTAYGQRIDELGPDILGLFVSIERLNSIVSVFVRFSLPGTRLVDHFPNLLRLPRALQWFRREAEEQGAKEERFFRTAFSQSKLAHANGEALLQGSSIRILEKPERFGFTDNEVALISAAPYRAGVTTTLATYDVLMLAILSHPHVMKRAQHEIDTIVGSERMPDFRDFESLVYIRAMIKEALRWHPFAPLAIPHATTEDDVYEGMFIPAGSTVIANVYAMTRNTELFPDPEEYRPERILEATNPLIKNYNMTFGFGRRICPGQHVATDQLFIIISRILWAFNIMPAKGDSDLPKVEAQRQHGRFGPVKPMLYELVPRSDHVRSVIMEQASAAEDDVKTWHTFKFNN
ncbi:Fumitremorgin C synthase [Leucoagaricus sp. SymC.cos]|nr:Fumitremorgin C synthase [Leucoagaricus sp. SymC.cos]